MLEIPRTIAVVGAGLMGRGIAQIAAQAGFDVAIYDVKPDAAAEARRAIAATLAMLAAKHKLSEDDAARATARIAVVGDLGELSQADLAIEAIVERLDAKQALFAALEAIVGKRCILATNTSSLSVTAIAAACANPERVAGLHFFSPVPLMKLVEVIGGLLTDPQVVERLLAFGAALGHTPVRARDTPGFIVNHAGRGYGTEALRILGEGIADVATIDRVLTEGAGFRMGPLPFRFDRPRRVAAGDGIDLSPVLRGTAIPTFPAGRAAPRRRGAGRKTGRGFYEYGTALRRLLRRLCPLPRRPPHLGERARQRRTAARRLAACAPGRRGRFRRTTGTRCHLPGPAVRRRCDDAALDEGLDPTRTVALDILRTSRSTAR